MARRLTSLLLLALVAAAMWRYVTLSAVPVPAAVVPVPAAAGSFHAFDRARLPATQEPRFCVPCHGLPAHRASSAVRAFLNAHQQSMDCGVCHLSGRSLAVRRFRGDEVVTAGSLAQGAGGRLYAVTRTEGGWQRVLGPDSQIQLQAAGIPCRDCHRRGSPFLATDGLFDRYRRLVLEDLSVLRWLGGPGR